MDPEITLTLPRDDWRLLIEAGRARARTLRDIDQFGAARLMEDAADRLGRALIEAEAALNAGGAA